MAITQVTINTKFGEWKDITNAIIDAVGDNDSLSTTAKSSLVAAINEVLSNVGDITTLSTTDKASVVAAVNEVLGQLGDISSLDGSFSSITNTVAALNNLVIRIGDLTALNTTANTNLVSAVNEVNTALATGLQAVADDLGDKSSLTTTDQTNLVAAINEIDGLVGDLSTLTTTEQSNLVGALNEVAAKLDADVGNKANLNTTDKTNMVAAINELEAAQLTRDLVPVENLLTNHGRYSAETTKVLTTFDSSMFQMTAFNAAVLGEGDRFLDDNSNYGGSGGSLGTDMGSLMTAIQAAGRADNRNGYEFYICDITAGGGTGDPETFSSQNYHPIVEGADAFLGPIGSVVTFQCWLRLKTVADEPTFGGILLGDSANVTTYVDGVAAAQQSILAVAGGWVHLRQTFVLTNEFKKFFPAIYANNGDVVQIALPVLYNADVNNGIHVGVM